MLHMEQNSYIPLEFIVFGEIINSTSHIREISRRTKINHMSIKRIAERLFNENVLDFLIEGKNKTFFLKDNLEAKNMKMIYEHYKRLSFIKNNPSIRKIFEKISNNKNISLAILFGSHAKGLAHKNSDIDIYVKTTSLAIKKEIRLIDSRISVKIGLFNKEELLIKEIMKNHIIIKGIEEYYGE